MTDELAALLDHLKVGPVNVLGWSDGAIEALLLGIRHPAKVKKIAAVDARSLKEVMDEIGQEAQRRGMTPAILESMLNDETVIEPAPPSLT